MAAARFLSDLAGEIATVVGEFDRDEPDGAVK
jgi:hypothetical protein